MLASLPMYLVTPLAVNQLWDWLKQDLIQQLGKSYPQLALCDLKSPDNLHAHWQEPSLLVSQTCGYPLMTELNKKVNLLGSFEYDAPYCNGIFCKSVVIAQANNLNNNLLHFKNTKVAFNSPQSQSGYNSFRHLIAPLSQNGGFFENSISTGGHKASVLAVQSGQADIAAIDCVTYEGFCRYAPELTQGLKIINTTQAYPGLPLISALNTPTEVLDALKNSLSRIHLQEQLRDTLATLMIKQFKPSSWQDYEICLQMEKEAQTLGYQHL